MKDVPSWYPENVSRETLDRLTAFQSLVASWSPKINLVSRRDLDDIWDRHIWDSVQVWLKCPIQAKSWADLGSGGGFPGVVVAIMAADTQHDLKVTMVESDQRKCAFLRTAIRTLDLRAKVVAARIENCDLQGADVISARALASLADLLKVTEAMAKSSTTFLFPKGVRWKEEVEAALEGWRFDYQAHQSHTDKNAALLELTNVSAN